MVIVISFGEKLYSLRKTAGLSQEEVAEQLGVSRQTVSNWETNQTVPDIMKAKNLSQLYHIGYNELMSISTINSDLTSIEHIVEEIDWTSAWSKKYPILATYQNKAGIPNYAEKISELYDSFKQKFQMNDVDTVLILKDILYHKYKSEIAK